MVLQMQDSELKARGRFFEQMLCESEEKYRLLVENSPNLIGILQDGLLKYVNRTACEKLGWTFEEMLSPSFDPIETIIPPRLRDRTREIVARRIFGEKIHPYELSLLTRDGSEITVVSYSQRITYHGKPADEIIFVDITDRMKMREEIERLAKFPTENPNPVLRLGLDGTILDTNKASESLLQSWKCRVGEKAPKFWTDLVNELYPSQSTRSLDVQVGERTVLLTLVPVKDAGYVNVYGRDITERRLLEGRYRTLFETMAQGAVYQDKDGKIFLANPAAETILGLTLDQMQGRTSIDPRWKAIHEDGSDFPGETHPSMVVLKTGKEARNVVMGVFNPKDEKHHWILISAIPQFAPGETKPFQVYTTFTDITERKEMEKELKKHSRHLEELVDARTREISELSQSVSEKLTKKIDQIENISRLRDSLRKTPDTSTGLDLVLDGAVKDLQMDAGAVLVFDQKERVTNVRAFKSRIEGIMLNESYPLNCGLSECEVLTLDKTVSKIEGKSCILKTTSIHCAPIHLGKEMHGSLVLGTQKAITLDESDLTVLRLYANLASTVFEIDNLAIAPVKEVDNDRKIEPKLEFGAAYLAKNIVEKTFEFFAQTVLSGVEGLCITREYPPKIRQKYGLKKTPVVWLTEEKVNGEITVYSLQDLSVMIGTFLVKANRGIVLLDGVEYLATNHGFESFLRFVQVNRSRFESLESILVIPVTEGTISERELRLIERETKMLKISYR
jgi:PAS domain S-box-containing protein